MTDTSTVPAQRGVRQGRDARAAKRRTRVQRWLPELERRIPWVDLLDEEQVKRIHDASMDIIEDVGVEFRLHDASGIWRSVGSHVDR